MRKIKITIQSKRNKKTPEKEENTGLMEDLRLL